MIQNYYKKGFTIVELMLAMTFVSFLAISIAVTTIQMSNLTVKGNTLSELNKANRALNDDFKRSFNSISNMSGWTSNTPAGAPGSDVYYLKNGNGGAFCTGKFSYLWNNGSHISSLPTGSTVSVRYDGADAKDTTIRLIRVNDKTRAYCQSTSSWVTIPRNSDTIEVLSAGDTDMMLFNISFAKGKSNAASNQSIVKIDYILGTKQDDGRATPANCLGSTDNSRCAAGDFTTIVRTLGQ